MLWFDVGTDNTGCHSPPSDSTSGWQSGCDASYIIIRYISAPNPAPLCMAEEKMGIEGLGVNVFL